MIAQLASFSLKYPKTIVLAVVGVALAAFATHYTLIKNERDKLRIAETGYKAAVKAFTNREAVLREDQIIAERATVAAIAARDADRATLNAFRQGRENDAEAVAWGSQPIPVGERGRLCIALPELVGCPSTVENN